MKKNLKEGISTHQKFKGGPEHVSKNVGGNQTPMKTKKKVGKFKVC